MQAEDGSPPTDRLRRDGLAADAVLVHTSDLHVGDDAPVGTYTGLLGLASVLATARSLAADIVLLAGDTFDHHRVADSVLRQAAELIAAAGMPVVMLPGNHDSLLPDCVFRRAGIAGLPNVHLLGLDGLEGVIFPQHALEVWGHAHCGYDDMAPLRGPRPRTTRWQVAMAHGHYVPPEDRLRDAHRAWKFTDQDLAAVGADYIALGHWDRAVQAGDGSVPAYYSGSPDLAGTVNVIRLSTADGVVVERVPLVWT